MDNEPNKLKLHPLTAAAAVAVILVSATGIAAMTGLLPNFSKTPDQAVVPASTDVAANTTASQPAASSDSTPVNEAVTAAAVTKKAPLKKPTVVASNSIPAPTPEPVAPVAVEAPPPQPPAPPPCVNCGVVESAHAIQQQAPASGLGAAAGAVLGGVLGHQVGGGNGKTLTTIAGAVGGGLAGNAVEKNAKSSTAYEVVVLMDNGSRQRFVLKEQRWRSGDLVQINNGQIAPRNQ